MWKRGLNVVRIWVRVCATREQYAHEIYVGHHDLDFPVCRFSVILYKLCCVSYKA